MLNFLSGDEAVEANPELAKALDRVFALGFEGRPTDRAEAYADLFDQIPQLAGTDWAKKMREAKYDGDRVGQVMDEFCKWSEEQHA